MGGKIGKTIGKVVKKVAAPALAIGGGLLVNPLAIGGGLLGGPAGAALGGSLGELFGGGMGSGIGQIGGGVYDYYNNRTIDKGVLEAQLKAGEEASQLLNPYYQTGTAANQRLSNRLMSGFNIGNADKLARNQYNSGLAANPKLTDRTLRGFKFNQADLYNDPGYQFAVDQGQRRLNAQAAAGGLLGSGRALKEATQYGQGMAEGQFNNVYNRNFNTWDQENQNLRNLVNGGSNAYQGAFNRWNAVNEQLGNSANRGQDAAFDMGTLRLGMGADRAKYRSSRGAERANLVGNITQGLYPLLSNLGDYMQQNDVPVSKTPSFIQNQFAMNRPGGSSFRPALTPRPNPMGRQP